MHFETQGRIGNIGLKLACLIPFLCYFFSCFYLFSFPYKPSFHQTSQAKIGVYFKIIIITWSSIAAHMGTIKPFGALISIPDFPASIAY